MVIGDVHMIILKEEEITLATGSIASDKVNNSTQTQTNNTLIPQNFDSKAWKLYPNAVRFMGSDNLPLIYRFKLAKANLIGDKNYIQFYIPNKDNTYRCFIYKKKQKTKEDTIEVMKNVIAKLDGKTADFIVKALEVSSSGFKEVFLNED